MIEKEKLIDILTHSSDDKFVASYLKTKQLFDGVAKSELLRRACFLEKLDIVKLLLADGAEVNDADAFGVVPLALAVENLNFEITSLLLEWGADVHVLDKLNQSILMRAVDCEIQKAVNDTDTSGKCVEAECVISGLLLKNGANPFLSDSKGDSPYSLATFMNHKEFVKMVQHQ